MENTLLIAGGILLAAYLIYCLVRCAIDLKVFLTAGSKAGGLISLGAIVILLCGIAACVVFVDSRMPRPHLEVSGMVKDFLRPFMSAAVSLMLLVYVALMAVDLVAAVKRRVRKDILFAVAKTVVAVALAAWMIADRWQWILE